jgi:adenylate cyclase
MAYKIDMINEKEFEIVEDQTILQASLEAGIPHYHACGGNAQCSTCRVVVHEGKENLSPQNDAEIELRKQKHFADNVRLACQTKVIKGNVKLQRIIKDEADLDLYVYGSAVDGRQSIGREQELALFFLDIRNFTPFIEKHLPFDVIHIIRRLMKLFSDTIAMHNGRVVEYEGDGLYAVFGLEQDITRAIANAEKAGQKIIEEVRKLNSDYIEEFFDSKVEIGIGLHSGKVIVGEPGVNEQSSLTAMGFPVNVASRLESATKELNNNFIISDYTYNFLKRNDQGAEKKQIMLKGVSEPFNVRLLGHPFDYEP